MSGYQFIHIEAFAHSASKKSNIQWNAREILAEAVREKGACGHVQDPQAPIELHGKIADLIKKIDEYEVPKGTRKDTPIMIGGVISAPWPPGDPRSQQWQMDCLKNLKNRFGRALECVIAHIDEEYDHIHFYVTNQSLSHVRNLHPGMAARADFADDRKAGKAAYTKAMEAFQDDFHQAVSVHYGHARKGPGRERLSRFEWRERQDGNEKHAELLKKIKIQEEEIRQKTLHIRDLGAVARVKEMEAKASEARAQEVIKNAMESAKRSEKDSERLRLLEANLVEREKALEMKLEYATKLTAKLEAEAKNNAIEIIARIRKMGPR